MSELTPQLAVLFAISLVAGLVFVRASIFVSHKLDILDHPDLRKAHRGPIAYLGGLGMFLTFAVGWAVLALMRPDMLVTQLPMLRTILAGATLVFLVGFWDDVRPLRAVVKLMLQMAIGAGMWWFGARIGSVSMGDEAILSLGSLVSLCITVGWYVALMNSINLVDGLDGLAGGVSFLGALSLVGVAMVSGYSHEVFIGAGLATIVAGATLGYLRYNWCPAKTFMGDGGSLLLGFLLASSSLVGSAKTPTLLALSVPLVALGLPLFESSFSFFRRAIKGQHPFKPDRRHLHHRLLDLGLDQQRVVIFLLFLTAVLGVNAIILAQSGQKLLFINVLSLVAGIVLLIENLKYLERGRQSGVISVPPPDSEPSVSTKSTSDREPAHVDQGSSRRDQ
ncbi:hypothetical protein GC173_09995 [bacterium]|nr:hypothetical protein [bacterium]